jgi:lysozyme
MLRLRTVAVAALLTGALSVVGVGCSSSDPAPGECLGSGAAPLKTCAKGTTITGVDVSVYQGNVNWTQIKGSGRQFGFARISDGLNSPDTKFAQNWPSMRAAGIVRGAYQYFRPSQDPALQAQMVLDKLAAAGGLKAGDLPPVLDLETADGLAASVVVTKAKAWLAKVEAGTGVKPIVYTAAFMSNVVGTSFGGYTLWVANYGATCPTMPSGWTNWQFWQNADNGSVPGISGNVDTDLFNGTLPQLQALTLAGAAAPAPGGLAGEGALVGSVGNVGITVGGATPQDGSQGATLGQGAPPPDTGAALPPCR